MYWPRLLREYPPGTLDAIRRTVAALLGYQDVLPTDLYVPLARKAPPPMTQHSCACGYQAESTEDLTDHLGEMFIPADDIAPDGQVHAEAARPDPVTGALTCRCGFTGVIADFDQHLVNVFTPADQIGLDSKRHAAA